MAAPGLHLTANCEICSTPFRQSRSDQRFCSGRCGQSAFRKRRLVLQEFTCPGCGIDVVTPKNIRRKTCGKRECREAIRPKTVTTGEGKGWSGGRIFVPRTPCQMCGTPFYAPPIQRRRGGGRFCSVACRQKDCAQHPERYPQTTGRRGIGGKRADLGGMYFRSAWEANWARYLNWLKALGEIREWKFEVDTFQFHKIKRGSRFYTPDFRVMNKDGTIEYHEIKGYMDQRSQTKLNRMRKYYPSVRVILIAKPEYRAVANKVGRMIPGWESHRNQLRNT